MRALVVGLGKMGGFHRDVLAGLGFDVTTVDPDPARGADHETIPLGHFDAVAVATPIDTLPAVAVRAAASAHPQHLLVEKPFARSVSEASLLARALRAERVCVGFVERFNPVVRRLIEDAKVGEVESIEFTRLNDRPTPDARIDLWSHDLDLSMYLTARGVNTAAVRFRADGDMPHRVRCIQVTYPMGTVSYDLMDHNENPLRLQWEAFLAGDSRFATPEDALRVLRTIESTSTMEIAA